MICKQCNNNVPNDSEYCPFCGSIVEKVIAESNPISDIEKGYTYLELKEWKKAKEIFDFAIVNNDNKARAYIGRLLAKLKLSDLVSLTSVNKKLTKFDDFKMAVKYADDNYKQQLKKYYSLVEEKINQKRAKSKKRAIIFSISSISLIVLLVLTYFVFIPLGRFSYYQNLLSNGKIEKATKSYSDSKWFEYDGKVKELFYKKAIESTDDNEFINAEILLKAIPKYKDSADKLKEIDMPIKLQKMQKANVGDYVEFGSYEQDGDFNNGSENIEWLVLDKAEEKALLISKYGLDCIPFANEDVLSYTPAFKSSATWETSYLRNWLNDSFYNEAFSDFEKKHIQKTMVENYDYTHQRNGSSFTTKSGAVIQGVKTIKVTKNPTNDFLYVFSEEEIEKYFPTSKSRKVKPTEYAKKMGADISYGDGKHAWWWLRTNPDMNSNHSIVSGKGGISTNSLPPDNESITVRPAMWINISETK